MSVELLIRSAATGLFDLHARPVWYLREGDVVLILSTPRSKRWGSVTTDTDIVGQLGVVICVDVGMVRGGAYRVRHSESRNDEWWYYRGQLFRVGRLDALEREWPTAVPVKRALRCGIQEMQRWWLGEGGDA